MFFDKASCRSTREFAWLFQMKEHPEKIRFDSSAKHMQRAAYPAQRASYHYVTAGLQDAVRSREDLVTPYHATCEVVADMTVKQPGPFVVRYHIRDRHRHRT
jgi:hypothetical protein